MSSFPSAQLPSVCAACKQPGALQVGQLISDGRLTWFERFSCACGHGFEADGAGLPTPAARAALLAQSGTAELWLDSEEGRAVLTKLLTRLAGVEEGEATSRLARLPALAWSGTHAEVAFMQAALEKNGVEARVVHRVASSEGSP
ncbi:MAG: hypothetical protein AB1938_14795 [Myxococcota bacterium]